MLKKQVEMTAEIERSPWLLWDPCMVDIYHKYDMYVIFVLWDFSTGPSGKGTIAIGNRHAKSMILGHKAHLWNKKKKFSSLEQQEKCHHTLSIPLHVIMLFIPFIKALVCKWSFLIIGSPLLEVGLFHFSPNYKIASHYNLCSVYSSQDFSLILNALL